MLKKIFPQQAPWLFQQDVQALLAHLNQQGGAARIVGGAVRNTLLGEPVEDIDIATTWPPQKVISLAQKAGFHTVPTGLDFGTVTIIINHRPFEVTSLRADLASNGRHAVVAFGQDWQVDANRRDFTINALYCDAKGKIYDEVGGLEDIKARRIRFIGEADARIEEDYLRILRFFRFFACYGEGRPDTQALRAIVRQREGLHKLSAERIWGEIKKLLRALSPHRSLLWMRQSGVLSLIVPESEKWGIDLIPKLIEAEKAHAFLPDPLLRLMSIIPPEEKRARELAARLKLSGLEKKRLVAWTKAANIHPDIAAHDLKRILYVEGLEGISDKVKLALAANLDKEKECDSYREILKKIDNWQRPSFPLNGRDLIEYGIKTGSNLGKILAKLEADWVESDFHLTKNQLLSRLV